MNIVFQKLRFKNFLSYGNEFEELDLTGNQKILFAGMVGSGKSTFTEALTFVLFGKAYRNINIPQLTNSINKKDCLVEMEFLSNNREILVRRGLKPNIFEVWIDGVMLDQTGKYEYQDIFETEYLGMNYTAFSQIVLIGKTSFEPFMKLTKGKRREMVDYVLGLTVITKMVELLKADLSRIKEEQTRLENDLLRQKDKRDYQQRLLQQYKQTNEFHEGNHTQQISELEKNISQEEMEIESKLKELKEISIDIQKKEKIEQKINQKNDLLGKAKTKKWELESKLDSLHGNNVICPNCGHDINSEKHEKQRKKIQDIIDTINEKLPELEEQNLNLTHELGDIAGLREKHLAISSAIEYHKRIVRDKKEQLQKVKKQYSTWKNSKQIDENELVVELETIETAISELKKEIDSKEKERENVEIAELALKDEGIKSEIINKYIPLFNIRIREYLYNLDFFVDFRLDEHFNGKIFSLSKKEFSYSSFSEGEKLKIDIAVMLAWRDVSQHRNSMSTNLLIFDETFDSSLDVNDINSSLSLFRSFAETNLIVISHTPERFIKAFDTIKKVRKQGHFSLTENFSTHELSNQVSDIRQWLTE